MLNFRTDMADERLDIFKRANNIEGKISGIETFSNKISNSINVTSVKVQSKEGEMAVKKPVGTYVTVDVKNLKALDDGEFELAVKTVSDELRNIVESKIKKQDEILVVGLGNQFVTPDALGPKVISEIEVTRHLLKYAPECVVPGARSVCSIAPGVLGTTGIETLEIVKGVVKNIKPKLLIVVDSLASRSIARISSTIQISDTGIVPGGGVGNARMELSEKTLDVPVVAIGVPMVVDLATITDECLDLFIEKLQQEARSNDIFNKIKSNNNYDDIYSALAGNDYNMIVTPKEIDDLIEKMKGIVAESINSAI